MVKHIASENMGRSRLGWLDSYFHFSFAEYFNPDNINFGVLRVINDDIIQPGTGFDTHPHKDMEILTYVIEGELTHVDSMGNKRTLGPGQVQYMSAGTGITHSEHNLSKEVLRLLQIWIFPDKEGYTPNYGQYEFSMDERRDKWLKIATSFENKAEDTHVSLHADVNIYGNIISKGNFAELNIAEDRQAYLLLAEGEANINSKHLFTRDALEVIEEPIKIHALEEAHIIVIEMSKAT